MNDILQSTLPWLAAAAGFVGWKGLLFLLLGMAIYHQMLKRFPRLLAWLLSGVKSAGDAVKDELRS